MYQFGVMCFTHQCFCNWQGLENGMILRKTGLFQMRQKKGQAVGPFRVTIRRFMADAFSMAINSHNNFVSRTS